MRTVATLLLLSAVLIQAQSDDVQKALAGKLPQGVILSTFVREDGRVRETISRLLKEKLTADSAVQIALLSNAELQARFETLGISQADIASAGLMKNPTLSAQSRWADRDAKNANLELAYSQDIVTWFLGPLRKKLATRAYEKAQLEVADSVLQLASETKAAFYTLQAQMQLLGRLKLIVQTNQAANDFAQKQRTAGNISELAWLNQQTALSQSRRDVAKLLAEMAASREALNRLIGLWGRDIGWKMAGTLPPLPKVEVDLADVENVAVERRTDLEIGRAQLSLAASALGVQGRTRLLPASIQLGIDYERESDGTQLAGPRLEVELPFFDSGKPELARKRAEFKQAQWELAARAINVRSEAREARDGLIAARDLAEFYRDELLPQRVKILNATQLEYNGMFLGFYDLLRARQEELEAERGYVEAWRDYWIARAKLERAIGGSLSLLQKTTSDHSKD